MSRYVVIEGCGFRPHFHRSEWASELSVHQEPKLTELLDSRELERFLPFLAPWGNDHPEPHLFLSEDVSELAYIPDTVEVDYKRIRDGILTIKFDGEEVYPPDIQKKVKMSKQYIAALFRRGGSELAGREIRDRIIKVVHGFDPGIPMHAGGIINKCVAEVAGISSETSRTRIHRMKEKGEFDIDLLFRPSGWVLNDRPPEPSKPGPYNDNWPEGLSNRPRWHPGDPWPEKEWKCRKPEIRIHAL